MDGGVTYYFSRLVSDEADLLRHICDIICLEIPDIEVFMSYGIPTFKKGRVLFHLKSGPRFCSFITTDKQLIRTFSTELKGYDTTGTTIHFSVSKPIPDELLHRIVRARMKSLL